ncbi:MAG: hypothetical protein IPK07_18510 [Deltaproteobacteria bacterium]|jgi:dienelactone hydrolase|nr:hypothetical protein [Deltaproteobacteria bacterium]
MKNVRSMSARRGLALGWIVTSLAGCVIRTAAPDPAPLGWTRRADPFAYRPNEFPFTLAAAPEEAPGFATWMLDYPSHDTADTKNPSVHAVLRYPHAGSDALIVVLPILGGDYSETDYFARGLADRGFATLRFDRKADVLDSEGDFQLVARRIRNTVVDVRRGIDLLASGSPLARQPMAFSRVGLLGISLGSMIGSLIAAYDPRVDATALVLTGGDFAEVLDHARDEVEVKAFLAGLESRGYDADRIRHEAHWYLDAVDPLRHAASLDPSTTLMVQGRFDPIVPFDVGTWLWEAAHRPERVVLPTGHYSAVLFLPYIEGLIEDHFERHLAPH